MDETENVPIGSKEVEITDEIVDGNETITRLETVTDEKGETIKERK